MAGGFGGSSTSGGSGGSSSGFGGGSSGGRKSSGKKPPGQNPKTSLVRLAARLGATGNLGDIPRSAVQEAVTHVLSGLDDRRLTQLGRSAGLTSGQTHQLRKLNNMDPGFGVGSFIDLVDRPRQAVVSGLSGGDSGQSFDIGSAWQGFLGHDRSTPTQAVFRGLGGESKQEAIKHEARLNPIVRGAANFAGDVALDPLTYVGFGTPYAAKQAARTAAKSVVGQAAVDAALSPEATTVYQDILARGARTVLGDEAFKALPGKIRRELNRAQGGLSVAGHSVRGTRGVAGNVGPRGPEGFLAGAEQYFRPQSVVRQAERAGTVAPGTTQSVENLLARERGAEYLGGLEKRQVEKGAQEALGRRGLKRAQKSVGTVGTEAMFQPEAAARSPLDVVREALDIQGGPSAVTALPPELQQLAGVLRGSTDRSLQELTESGRLLPEDVAQATIEGGVVPSNKYFPVVPEGRATGPGKQSLVPGRTPGFVQGRTERELAASERVGKELDPVIAIGGHAKAAKVEAERTRIFGELGKMSDTKGNPLVLDRESAKAIQEANPDTWKDTYVEITGPSPADVNALGPGERLTDQPLLIHKSIEPEFRKMIHAKQSSSVRKALEYVNALWARSATATSGFISRNVLQGNLYMGMVLAEARDPRDWFRSFGLMHRIQQAARSGNLEAAIASLPARDQELIRTAIENNAVESGFFSEISKQAASAEGVLSGKSKTRNFLTGSMASPVSPEFAPFKGISYANQFMENSSRLAVYINKVRQGFPPAEAAAIARHYLLDYRNLAPVGDTARLINPFFTWAYKTAPLMTAELVKDPRKITIPLSLMREVNAEGIRSEGMQGQLQPEFITEGGGVTLPKGIREHLPFGLDKNPVTFLPATPINSVSQNLQPLADLAIRPPGWERKLPTDLINSLGLGGGAGGALQSGYEAATGTELFSGRQVPAGTRVELPAVLQPFLGKTIPWEANNALSNLVPWLSRLNTLSPSGTYDTGAQNRRLVSMLAGLSLFPQTKKTEKGVFYDRLALLQALQKSITSSGGEVPLQDWSSK